MSEHGGEKGAPADVPSACPSCGSVRGIFWTMTDLLCLTCHWHTRRVHPTSPGSSAQPDEGEL